MSTRHTPGEWFGKDGQIYPLETGKTLAVIPYWDKDSEEQQANLAVLTEAKNMLTALNRISGLCSAVLDHQPEAGAYARNMASSMRAISESAISKAEGRG